MVLLHPELAVGQEEILGLGLAVIVAAAVPCGMVALRPAVEIQGVMAVEVAEAFELILDHVRMHHEKYQL